MVNLQALLYFYETAQHASINRTANQCFVSASSLSRALSGLEKELNTTLFERTHTGIELTRAGRELFEQVRPSIEHLKEVMDGYANGGPNRETMRLRVCAYQSSIVAQAMINFYRHHEAEYEYVDIILDAYLTAGQVLDQMEAADYMLGLIHFPTSELGAYQELLHRRGYDMISMPKLHGCITVRAGHPLASLKEVKPEQLTPYPRVAYISEDPWEMLYCSDFHNFRPKEVRKRILVKERGFLHDVLRNTDAYFVGVNSGPFELLGGTLVSVPTAGMKNSIETLLFYRRGRTLTRALLSFIDEIRDVFQKFET